MTKIRRISELDAEVIALQREIQEKVVALDNVQGVVSERDNRIAELEAQVWAFQMTEAGNGAEETSGASLSFGIQETTIHGHNGALHLCIRKTGY